MSPDCSRGLVGPALWYVSERRIRRAAVIARGYSGLSVFGDASVPCRQLSQFGNAFNPKKPLSKNLLPTP
jgi:hypothetical protein